MKYSKDLVESYYTLKKSLKLYLDIQPLNLLSEKVIFMDAYNGGKVYNPIFKYRSPTALNTIENLLEIKKKLKATDFYLYDFYESKIDSDINWITIFHERSGDFNIRLSKLYGYPSQYEVKYADDILQTVQIGEDEISNIEAASASKLMEQAIDAYGFSGWSVVVTDEMTAKMSVNHLERKVKVDASAKFSDISIEKLIVHEIGTHVLRGVNGRKQSDPIFWYGFDDYLETEEGLAIWSEDVCGLRNEKDKLRYALRLLCCSHAENMSFYEIYKFCMKYVDSDTSFSVAARIKRGLEDTSSFGGYTKDQVYLSGYLKVKRLSIEEIKKLYIGKVPIEFISLLDTTSMDISRDVFIPEWVK